MRANVGVFIVEDSAFIRERMVRDVALLGNCTVVGIAESENEAVMAIDELRPTVIVTDIQLKQGSGIGVVRKVRAQSPPVSPVIIVLTNYATSEYRHACLASGADEFLDKTSEYELFLALMKQECQNAQSTCDAATTH
jgi:diguanylate cyclase